MGRPPNFTGDHAAVTAVFTRMLTLALHPQTLPLARVSGPAASRT